MNYEKENICNTRIMKTGKYYFAIHCEIFCCKTWIMKKWTICLQYMNYEKWKCLFTIHELWKQDKFAKHELWKYLFAIHELWKQENIRLQYMNYENLFLQIMNFKNRKISPQYTNLENMKIFVCNTWIMKIFVCYT